MILVFNQGQSGAAQHVGTLNSPGWITVQVFGGGGLWIGHNKSDLESVIPSLSPETRNGHYIGYTGPSVVQLPWMGDLWALNGTGLLDQPAQWAAIEMVGC